MARIAEAVNMGQSENAMLADVSISITGIPTAVGKPWPPYSAVLLTAPQPAATNCS